MSARPTYTKKDKNHNALVKELRQVGYTVVDVANLPGRALDIFVGGYDHTTSAWAWVQVEIKESRKARFTESERAYFCELGITDPWIRGDNVAVIAAVTAEDVLRWFGATIMPLAI